MSLNYHINASVKLVTFDRENQIIPCKVFIFLPTLFYTNHRNICTVVMKNMINTIGKKIHTLVKENTPHRHKIRQECGFTQKFTFFYRSLCFLPYCCANIGREVRLCFLTHTKKYLTPIYALIFEKHVKMCVSIRGMKKPV